jgi:hypothetical protein
MTGRTCWLLAKDRSVTIGRHGLGSAERRKDAAYHLRELETVARFLKIAAAD